MEVVVSWDYGEIRAYMASSVGSYQSFQKSTGWEPYRTPTSGHQRAGYD